MCTVTVDSVRCEQGACLAAVSGLASIRHAVHSFLREAPADRVADAVLVVDELIGNAFTHARQPRQLLVQRHDAAGGLRVEVSDASPDPPRLAEPDVSGHHGGYGLHLVDRLSTSWGVVQDSGGKTVWSELPLQ